MPTDRYNKLSLIEEIFSLLSLQNHLIGEIFHSDDWRKVIEPLIVIQSEIELGIELISLNKRAELALVTRH